MDPAETKTLLSAPFVITGTQRSTLHPHNPISTKTQNSCQNLKLETEIDPIHASIPSNLKTDGRILSTTNNYFCDHHELNDTEAATPTASSQPISNLNQNSYHTLKLETEVNRIHQSLPSNLITDGRILPKINTYFCALCESYDQHCIQTFQIQPKNQNSYHNLKLRTEVAPIHAPIPSKFRIPTESTPRSV